jgi:hypothetical protein
MSTSPQPPTTNYKSGRGFRQRFADKEKDAKRTGLGYSDWWQRQTGPTGQLFGGINTNYDWRNYQQVGLMNFAPKAKAGKAKAPQEPQGVSGDSPVSTWLGRPKLAAPAAPAGPGEPAAPAAEPWTPNPDEPFGPAGPQSPVAPPGSTWVGGAQFVPRPADPMALPWGPGGPVHPTQVKRSWPTRGGGNWPAEPDASQQGNWVPMK